MFNPKKLIAVFGAGLMMLQGAAVVPYGAPKAEAAPLSPAVQDVVSKPFPHLMANQWHASPEGSLGGNHAARVQFAGKYLDIISLNRGGSGTNDLFLDNADSTRNPNTGLLKLKNELKAASAANGKNIKVLPYLNMTDVWTYQSVNSFPNWNFWHKPNGQNIGTWDFVKKNNMYLKSADDPMLTYWNGQDNRPLFDSRNTTWQQYYADHAKGIVDQGFDGIFSDNWLRSKLGELGKLQQSDFENVQKGWNAAGQKVKAAIGNKLLIGNSPPLGVFTSRDMCMLEDRIAPTGSGDKSVPAYLNYSDQAVAMGQVCLDTYWDEAAGPFADFRVPMALLTDNPFGLPINTKGGKTIEQEIQPFIEKMGSLGYAKGARYKANGVYQRDFDLGKVLVNDTGSTVTVSLPSNTYKKVDGTAVNSVTLAGYRGIVLKKSGSVSTPPPTTDPTTPPPTTDPTTPPPTTGTFPSTLSSTGITKDAETGESFINLKWNDISNDTGYQVQQSTSSTGSFSGIKSLATNTSSYGVNIGTNPTAGTKYFRIAAYTSGGTIIATNTISVTIGGSTSPTPTPTAPAAPSSLKVNSVGKSSAGIVQVNLGWTDASTNETGFQIQQSIGNTTNFQTVKTVAASTSTGTVDLGATPTAGTYNYRVLAVNGAGSSSPSNVVSATISATPSSTFPSTLSTSGITSDPETGEKFINLKWTDMSNDTGYQVMRSTSSTGSFTSMKSLAANTTFYGVNIGTNPTPGTYYFKINAYTSSGTIPATNTISVTVN